MKTIKTIIPLIVLFVSSFGFGQIVNIPDANFKAKLLEADATNSIAKDLSDNYFKIDANNDGEIQESEALLVSSLSIDSSSGDINTLDGIEYFFNIEVLSVNSVITLDLNTNTLLRVLEISGNTQNINILNCVNLEEFRCLSTSVTSLDLNNLPALEEVVIVPSSTLDSIDVSNCLMLMFFSIVDNIPNATNLNTINLSGCTNLYQLDIQGPSTNLDITNCVNLTSLQLFQASPNQLDFSTNLNLASFEMSTANTVNNLDLDFSMNPFFASLNINSTSINSINIKNGAYNNVSLNINNDAYICVDENELSQVASIVPFNNVNTYCSFIPGGNYNSITGISTLDLDNNGCDVNDLSFSFLKLNIDDGTDTGSTFTTNNGEYNFYTQDGTFTITPDLENPSFFNTTPIDATINFTDTNNNIAIQDFCITANGVHNDVEIVMAPTIPARPGFDAEYLITYKNKGNQTLSGDFSFTYDDAVLDYVSATEVPTTQTTGVLTWDYINLLPFESRSVYVTLNVNSPTETPAINIDDVLDFTVVINPIAGDELPNDNTFNYSQTVVGSYDPNDITCIEGDVLEPSQIGEYLHYIINFENTGNYPAENIVVATEIDPTMFDVSTLRVLSSSHDAYVKQTGNLIEIVFESIYLASGGHGNILLKVQSQDVLVEDDTVTKSANIFFDYNFPIQTNDANTTFQQLLSTIEYGIDQNVTIYPNPVKNWITISSKENIKSVSVFDVQGRVLQTQIVNSKEIKLDLANRNNGVYFIKIQTEKGIKVEKVIKQ